MNRSEERTRARAKGIAVVDLESVLLSQAPYVLPCIPLSLSECYSLADRYAVSQLWFTPGALAFLGMAKPNPKGQLEAPFYSGLTDLQSSLMPGKSSAWFSIWKKQGHFVELSFPSWEPGSSNPWGRIEFGPELLGELLTFTEATGMLWNRSGAITSDVWLRENNDSKRSHLGVTLHPEVARDQSLEPDLCWTAKEFPARATHCYGFDLNAMYLGAASSLALPVGEFQRSEPVETNELMLSGLPGYWQLIGNNGELTWVTTPTAQYSGQVALDGYYWPGHHRFLEPWYKMLRDARTQLLEEGGPALEAVKAVYRQGIGRLGSTRRKDLSDPLYQPYWRHAVQAEARTRLLRRIGKLSQRPVALDVDCAWFFTSSRTPEAFAKRIGLPLGTGIGQFKVHGSVPGKMAREILSRDGVLALRDPAKWQEKQHRPERKTA